MEANHVQWCDYQRCKGPDWSAAIAAWHLEEVFRVMDAEVGHAPGPNLARGAQTLERCYNAWKIGICFASMQ
jgi:hypothetical protein